MMNTTSELPSAIAAFFQAHNTGQTEGIAELFTTDALVTDEKRQYSGGGIRKWLDGAIAASKPIADVTGLARQGDEVVATAMVSGNFPGSPIQLRYRFKLHSGRIAALTIGP